MDTTSKMRMTCCEAERSNQQGRTSHTSRDRDPNTAEMKNKASALKNIIKMPKSYQKQNQHRKKATQKYTQEKRGIIQIKHMSLVRF